jgi:DNA-directed RNA polymerase subunit RPC12/RpoP
VEEEIKCADCGKICRGYRLVKAENYDKTKDKEPEFRCEECLKRKLEELRQRGVKV